MAGPFLRQQIRLGRKVGWSRSWSLMSHFGTLPAQNYRQMRQIYKFFLIDNMAWSLPAVPQAFVTNTSNTFYAVYPIHECTPWKWQELCSMQYIDSSYWTIQVVRGAHGFGPSILVLGSGLDLKTWAHLILSVGLGQVLQSQKPSLASPEPIAPVALNKRQKALPCLAWLIQWAGSGLTRLRWVELWPGSFCLCLGLDIGLCF